MTVLWMKFPDEVLLSARFDDAAQARLEKIFDCADLNSPWQQALALLKFPPSPADTRLLRWHQNAPYFNWSAMAAGCSLGAARIERQKDNSFALKTGAGFSALLAFIAAQWKISKFLHATAPPDLAQSLALGIALQFFVLQLGQDSALMGDFLAGSRPTPPRYRRTIARIQEIQVRRTQLSGAWHELFPDRSDAPSPADLPSFFWNDDQPEATAAAPPVPETSSPEAQKWSGVSVCTGSCSGLAVIASDGRDHARLEALKAQSNAPLILVFRNARPETTEVFALASAVLFAEGGVLSHAATVAREMNLPALTGLGPDFFACVKANEKIWLSLDADAATVQLVCQPFFKGA